MKLKKSSPKRKREVAKRTRRSVAVVQSTPVKKTASRRMSKSKSIAEEPETPSKQLAKEVESLTIRRSSRRSAIEANQGKNGILASLRHLEIFFEKIEDFLRHL